MTQQLLTPSIISKETLVMLENNLVAAGKVNRKFENQFVKIGTTLTVRKPNRFTVSSGPALQIQNMVEPSTSITVSNQKHVDFEFSSQELTLVVEEFSERYLKPASAELANILDYDCLGNFSSINNMLGTAGSTFTAPTFATLGAVGQRMDELAMPQEGRTLILNPRAYWALANALTSLFVRSVSEPALKGYLANIASFDIYESQNVQNQTAGLQGGTPVVSGANQTGSNLVTSGWTASTVVLNAGDVISIGSGATGCFAVNPKNRATTGAVANFVVTAAVTSDGSGGATIPVYQAITPSGAYQTVVASPVAGATINVLTGASGVTNANNVAITKDTFGLVTVPLELPEGVDFKARVEYKNISLRVIRAYDVQNDVMPCRLDILYGTTAYYPETGARLTN